MQEADWNDGGNDRHPNAGELTLLSQAMEDLAGLARTKFKIKHEYVGHCPAKFVETLLQVGGRINLIPEPHELGSAAIRRREIRYGHQKALWHKFTSSRAEWGGENAPPLPILRPPRGNSPPDPQRRRPGSRILRARREIVCRSAYQSFCKAISYTTGVPNWLEFAPHDGVRWSKANAMRYVWAIIIAVAIISLVALFVRQTRATFEQRARESAAASGHPWPEGSDPKNWQGVGIELSTSEIIRVKLADLLTSFWYLFVAIVVIACFAGAALAGRLKSSRRTSAQLEN
jgi:hypothetical protein